MDLQSLKQAKVWAGIVPAILAIWVISGTVHFLGVHSDVMAQINQACEVVKYEQEIRVMRDKLKKTGMSGSSLMVFEGKASASMCARAATIPAERLTQGTGSTTTKKRGQVGTMQNESYTLRAVRLIQVAKFIDYAEQNFSGITFHNLILTPVGTSSKDAWDATVDLRYQVE